jgi:hypothetical protein
LITRRKRLRTDEIPNTLPRRVLNDQRDRAWLIQMKSDRHGRVGGRLGGVGEAGGEKEDCEEWFHEGSEVIGQRAHQR